MTSAPVHKRTHVETRTSEPLGVVLDSAESVIVPKAPIDHCVNGQEVSHCGCEQTPL